MALFYISFKNFNTTVVEQLLKLKHSDLPEVGLCFKCFLKQHHEALKTWKRDQSSRWFPAGRVRLVSLHGLPTDSPCSCCSTVKSIKPILVHSVYSTTCVCVQVCACVCVLETCIYKMFTSHGIQKIWSPMWGGWPVRSSVVCPQTRHNT